MNHNAQTLPKWVPAVGTVGLALAAITLIVSMGRTSAKLETLHNEVSRLKQADPPEMIVREVRTERLVPVSTEVASGPATASPAEAPVELSAEGRAQHVAAVNQARLQACLDTYAKEAPDPRWSRSAEQTIQQLYATEEFRQLHISGECRTTMCRLDLSYPDSESEATAIKALVHRHPWDGPAFTQLNHETRIAFSYVAREGFDLPESELLELRE
jgi:hypothetical protein